MQSFGWNEKVVAFLTVMAFGFAVAIFAAPQSQSEAAAQSAASATGMTKSMASAGNGAANVGAGTKISAELESALDARTAKPGQQVEARVTKNVKEHGRTVIHKGDRLIGHVTQVQPGASGRAGSQIGVAFDQLDQGGATTQLNTVLTSVFSASGQGGMGQEPMPMAAPAPVAMPAGRSGGGGLLGGVGSTVGSTVGGMGSAAGSLGSTAQSATGATLGAGAGAGVATPIRAIHLNTQAGAESSIGSSSVLSTRQGNLRLDSGTRMEFRVAGQSQAGNAKRR